MTYFALRNIAVNMHCVSDPSGSVLHLFTDNGSRFVALFEDCERDIIAVFEQKSGNTGKF